MIHDKILGGKHIIQPKIALEMIQMIVGSKAFNCVILKINYNVQEVKSPYSFWWNFTFNYSLQAEMSLKEEEGKIFKDWDN